MTNPRVTQLINNNGNPVANHFVITNYEDDYSLQTGIEYLQSYKSTVASKFYYNGRVSTVTLGRDWDYSRTTMKYVGQYLGLNTKEIRAKIKSGEFVYDRSMV